MILQDSILMYKLKGTIATHTIKNNSFNSRYSLELKYGKCMLEI